MKSSIVVTGGAGFIGSNFVLDWIESEPGDVVNLDKLTYPVKITTPNELRRPLGLI